MEIFRVKKDISFMKYSRLSAVLSIVIFVLSASFLSTKGLNLGIDFTGGTIMEVGYPEGVNVQDIRDTLKSINLEDSQVQNFGNETDVLIRLPIKEGQAIADLSEKVSAALRAKNSSMQIR